MRVCQPILFGTAAGQSLMLRLYREGQIRVGGLHVPWGLARSGLIDRIASGRATYLLISQLHPAIDAIYDVLFELNGDQVGRPPMITAPYNAEVAVDVDAPLGGKKHAFRALYLILRAGCIDEPTFRQQMPDIRLPMVAGLINDLERTRLVVRSDGRLRADPLVPESYRRLATYLGEIFAKRDPRFATPIQGRAGPVFAFSRANDGAPRLFLADSRLRNLMALAKMGPMHLSDLERVVGAVIPAKEDYSTAPFGRSNVVAIWRTNQGTAVAINPRFPLAVPLRSLLLKLEERYPVAQVPPSKSAPSPPPLEPWRGDWHALFGNPIATAILMTIGALGWTFEALCARVVVGYERSVVKESLKTLEDEGILRSERPRRPGFNVRVVRIAEDFCASEQLIELLAAATTVWPEVKLRTAQELEHLSRRTKAHLSRRGLLGRDILEEKRFGKRRRVTKRECLDQYYALCARIGRLLSAHELNKADGILYRSIISVWSTFAKFRRGAGLPEIVYERLRGACNDLRLECIREYFDLSATLGHQPNTTELRGAWLYERIRIQWGGFGEFCEDLKIRPGASRRGSHRPLITRMEQCFTEYDNLVRRSGYAPTIAELRRINPPLAKRISKLWGSMRIFTRQLRTRARAYPFWINGPPKIIVLSRSQMRDFSSSDPHAVISFHSPGEARLKLKRDPLRKLRVNITCDDSASQERRNSNAMPFSSHHAYRIAALVADYGEACAIVVNCPDGVSQSAGVAVGIRLGLGFGGAEFSSHPYEPDPHIERIVEAAIRCVCVYPI